MTSDTMALSSSHYQRLFSSWLVSVLLDHQQLHRRDHQDLLEAQMPFVSFVVKYEKLDLDGQY
jgi:hypothetical protein